MRLQRKEEHRLLATGGAPSERAVYLLPSTGYAVIPMVEWPRVNRFRTFELYKRIS